MNFALANIVGIAFCGLLGGLVAWALVRWLDLGGVGGAIIAVLAGMIIATAAFALGIALLRVLGWLK